MSPQVQEEFFNNVCGVIEASRFEYYELYNKLREKEFKVKEILSGVGITVGQLDNRSVCISVWNMLVNGKKVLFWEPTSVLVDHAMIEAWFDDNWPEKAYRDNGSRKNRSDAENAFNVFNSLK